MTADDLCDAATQLHGAASVFFAPEVHGRTPDPGLLETTYTRGGAGGGVELIVTRRRNVVLAPDVDLGTGARPSPDLFGGSLNVSYGVEWGAG